jgi:hypothetical protein
MEATQLDLIFGWAALLSAVATIGTLVTGILFFAVNERFGKINDIVSVFQVVLMLPVAAAVYLLTRPGNGGLALLALAVGSMGMIVVAVLQALLVVGMVSFEQTIGAVLSAGAAIGLWLVLANVVALAGGTLPWGLGVFGMAAGIGYLLSAVGFHRGGQQHPLFYAGSILIVVGYLVWATWLGRLLQDGVYCADLVCW